MLDLVNVNLSRPMAELQYPPDLEDMAQLKIDRKALIDLKRMPTRDFDCTCELHVLPVRASVCQDWLRGCLVAPATYMESLLVTDPDWPTWRVEKTKKQQEMVGLAKLLGVWCVEVAVAELVASAIEQSRAAARVPTAESAATQRI